MKYTLLLFLCSLLLSTGCATDTSKQPEQAWQNMTGTWYGKYETEFGGTEQQIIHRKMNGTYEVRRRIYDAEGYTDNRKEAGYWGYSGTVYFTIYKGWVFGDHFSPTDPSDPGNYSAYKIIKLDDAGLVYRSASSQQKFSFEKVADDFDFPEL